MIKSFTTITALVFLLLAALPFCFASYFLTREAFIRSEMKQELKQGQLQTIVLEKHDIHWAEEGKELLINHHMFDVEKMTVTADGKLEVKGLYDEAEDDLYLQLERLMQNRKTQQSAVLFHFLFCQLNYEKVDQQHITIGVTIGQQPSYSVHYTDFFPSVYLTKELPPPKA